MEVIIENEDQLVDVVQAFLSICGDVKVVFLHGDLGAGKTTFVKKFVESLHVQEEVSSPTYSIVNAYATLQGNIYHIDLYRLNDTYEAQDIGIEEYLDSGNYCFIEWPSIVEHLVDQAIVIQIEALDENSRKFEIGLLNP